jgi:GrpB-like predicted nucleotidyltransferase (UPF0157 family)
MSIRVVPYDPAWVEAAQAEMNQIHSALGNLVVAIHHVGSTAIPGIHAKPVLDFMVEVQDLEQLDVQTAAMEALGYEAMGEYGIPDRRYFRKKNEQGVRTHHVHSFLAGSQGGLRHLAFRDYMIAHSDIAHAYSDLKRLLARQHPKDREAYIEGKDPFIKEHEQKALAWYVAQKQEA